MTTPRLAGPSAADPYPLSAIARLVLLARVWLQYAAVARGLRARGFPGVLERVGRQGVASRYPAPLLNRAVSRGLRVGRWQPRCLHRSLVLYSMLREHGEPAELVIGIQPGASSTDAHAWVEVSGVVVGPSPGSLGAAELVRYPLRPSDQSAASAS